MEITVSADLAQTGTSELQGSVGTYSSSTGILECWWEKVFMPRAGGSSGENQLIRMLTLLLP